MILKFEYVHRARLKLLIVEKRMGEKMYIYNYFQGATGATYELPKKVKLYARSLRHNLSYPRYDVDKPNLTKSS